jgi:hypothetical protein
MESAIIFMGKENIKFSQCLLIKHYAMKMSVGVDVHTSVSLISALVGGEWAASGPCRFTPCTPWIGTWVSPRTCLDNVERHEKSSPGPGLELRLLGRPVRNQSPYWLSYVGITGKENGVGILLRWILTLQGATPRRVKGTALLIPPPPGTTTDVRCKPVLLQSGDWIMRHMNKRFVHLACSVTETGRPSLASASRHLTGVSFSYLVWLRSVHFVS